MTSFVCFEFGFDFSGYQLKPVVLLRFHLRTPFDLEIFPFQIASPFQIAYV